MVQKMINQTYHWKRDVWESGVHALTKEEIGGIYEGRITNWKEVGGIRPPHHLFQQRATPRHLGGFCTGFTATPFVVSAIALLLAGPLGIGAAVFTETAPIMFSATIFAGATWPHGIKESPILSLPYHIFILAQDSFDPL